LRSFDERNLRNKGKKQKGLSDAHTDTLNLVYRAQLKDAHVTFMKSNEDHSRQTLTFTLQVEWEKGKRSYVTRKDDTLKEEQG